MNNSRTPSIAPDRYLKPVLRGHSCRTGGMEDLHVSRETEEIEGTGYRAAKQGSKLVLTLGYSHPVELEDPTGLEVEVPATNRIIVKGINKQQVGSFAAQVRDFRKPEPYKGKGIRYAGEIVRRKVGKTGK